MNEIITILLLTAGVFLSLNPQSANAQASEEFASDEKRVVMYPPNYSFENWGTDDGMYLPKSWNDYSVYDAAKNIQKSTTSFDEKYSLKLVASKPANSQILPSKVTSTSFFIDYDENFSTLYRARSRVKSAVAGKKATGRLTIVRWTEFEKDGCAVDFTADDEWKIVRTAKCNFPEAKPSNGTKVYLILSSLDTNGVLFDKAAVTQTAL